MSTLTVTTVQTANASTDLTLKTGNTSGPEIVLKTDGSTTINNINSLTVGNSTVNVAISSTGVTKNGSAALDRRKNYIVNPGMRISQENGTSSGTASEYHPVDQFYLSYIQDGTLTIAQVASATPGGSTHRIRLTVTSPDTSIGAGQFAGIFQLLEGLRVADLKWGTADAKDVVVRFGWKSPAGTYALAIRNQDNNRTFVREFTISGGDANTDTVQTLTIPGDTSGTWDSDNTLSIKATWILATGSTYQTTAGSWQGGNYLGTSSTSNGIGTGSDVFELFDVGMYADPDSTGIAPEFELPHYNDDLNGCKRYYRVQKTFTQSPAAGYMIEGYALTPEMRIDSWSSSVVIGGSASATSYVVASPPTKTACFMQLNASAPNGYGLADVYINARL